MARNRTAHWSALLGAARRGDERAYARFLAEAAPVIRGIVRARGPGLGAAEWEDLVQEVLLAVHAKRHTWRESEPLEPWLYAIARYKVIDAHRRRARGIDVPLDDHLDALVAPEAPDPLAAADMARVIDALDKRSARIVRAIGLEGASARETGARMGLSENAVRVALHRAMKRLAALRIRMIE
jgi:RNA polymerase sigma factor (sigma-70 family)